MAIRFVAKDQEKGAATITAKAPDKRSNDREAAAPNDLGETPATIATDLFNSIPKAPKRKRKSR
ncbi:hypothetical protein [Pseudaminobacter soli (ex Li et al. 2025)]|uniref:Uncharacterized protein n=1 Tax=Pseudaminobacter soli (ex Li et al. 2025) TaxID=1295366 RepID=A0A2P7SA58_9HYPH|nr:hypothetical protein [Mesorhizobium soli]PSJ59374.1 hypothetical protein C7I85_17370 [Mesorhizobium soli]